MEASGSSFVENSEPHSRGSPWLPRRGSPISSRERVLENHWGEQQHLDRFLQLYAVEKAKLEARKKGYAVSEQTLQDGSIKLQILQGA